MPLTTDSLLLGTWSRLFQSEAKDTVRVMDVGTGTGVLALMMAQRYAASESTDILIEASDIDATSTSLAQSNFKQSKWASLLQAKTFDFKNYVQLAAPESMQHIISNPPFFKNSLLAKDEMRLRSRHEEVLPLEQLMDGIKYLLSVSGFASIILPYDRALEIAELIRTRDLYISRKMIVCPREGSPPNRLLLEFCKQKPRQLVVEEIAVYQQVEGAYSEAYRQLTQDFYL